MIRFPPKMEFVSDPKKRVNAVEIFGPLVNMFITPKCIHFQTYYPYYKYLPFVYNPILL